jgi:hypothetical protein
MAVRDGHSEIARIASLIDEQIAKIRELNDNSAIEAKFIDQMLISRFYSLSLLTQKAAIALAVAAVRRGDITKRNAADRLHVHPHTIDRYITRAEADYESRKRHPLDPEVLQESD